jgi:hypothetical protein
MAQELNVGDVLHFFIVQPFIDYYQNKAETMSGNLRTPHV